MTLPSQFEEGLDLRDVWCESGSDVFFIGWYNDEEGVVVLRYQPELSENDTDNDGDGYSENQGDCNDNDDDIYPGASEISDGKDNDCDGSIDEDLNRPCSTACGSGQEVCYDGEWVDCDAPQPEPEVCDGLDNDCDGIVDNGNFIQYTGTDIGECRQGIIECVNGQMQITQQEIGPEPEVCGYSTHTQQGTEP